MAANILARAHALSEAHFALVVASAGLRREAWLASQRHDWPGRDRALRLRERVEAKLDQLDRRLGDLEAAWAAAQAEGER